MKLTVSEPVRVILPVPEITPLKVTLAYPPTKSITLSAVTLTGAAMVAPFGPGQSLPMVPPFRTMGLLRVRPAPQRSVMREAPALIVIAPVPVIETACWLSL